MSTATQTLDAVQSITEFANKASNDMRIVPDGKINVGQSVRQGDCYLVRLNDKGTTKLKNGVEINPAEFITPLQSDQLVPGNTLGSRHTVRRRKTVSLAISPTSRDFLQGPIIVAKERFTVEHPEHAHFSLPAGTYGVRYQLNAQTMRRVKD
jgi:hypothetical protein